MRASHCQLHVLRSCLKIRMLSQEMLVQWYSVANILLVCLKCALTVKFVFLFSFNNTYV